MPPIPASPALVTVLAEFVEERTGLHYGPLDRDLFVGKAADRAVEAGFDSLLDYYYFLRYDAAASAELDRLIDALVVGETYLFRELEQLKLIVAHFLLPVIQAGGRPRVWCAACATGEEPLTLAMLLADAGVLPSVEIVASDISERALARARSGHLSRRALRSVAAPELSRAWLTERHDGGFQVSARLLEAIDWRRVNLTDPAAVEVLGVFDVIVCRNVLIYFSDETTGRVVEHLSSALAPGGSLFVGVSESLLRFSTALSCEEREHVFYYRKPP
jgi:chemotaxis protein methyltransferase CheR